MGATTFTTKAAGTTPQAAFDDAVERAKYDYGHRGYTGTIAEKQSFVMITVKPEASAESALTLAGALLDRDDPRITDKWGPAGCIEFFEPDAPNDKRGRTFLFFGWAAE